MDEKLKSVIRMAVTAGALVSAVGLVAPAASAEASSSGAVSVITGIKFNCRYGIVCIGRSGGYLASQWKNNVAYSNKGTLGVAFSKTPVYPLPRGSQLKALKTGKIEARSAWTSVLYKCPKKYKYARAYVWYKGQKQPMYGNVIKCR
ncbi:hypothetical protein NE236_34655 [Actinoallomurus purpureus]|uniref:hypothetical protein n=1 Tax=Actinoallomurus purpureus TaxID=478114 RepID=UPI0020939C4A|nr:hypothetical protein [Actinoallomurus purpureus]MCO6010121.1 hypothetical protein [Actinoallomurus purpureus]